MEPPLKSRFRRLAHLLRQALCAPHIVASCAQRRSGTGYAMFLRGPSPRQGLGVFRHSRVSVFRSQTLNSLGGKHYG